jgi:hypothetical protein
MLPKDVIFVVCPVIGKTKWIRNPFAFSVLKPPNLNLIGYQTGQPVVLEYYEPGFDD